MNSQIVDTGNRLSLVEKNAVSEALGAFEGESGYEFCVMIVDRIDGKQYQEHARLMRQEYAKSIEKSLILVVSIDDRHAELATTVALSGQFSPGYTNKLLVTHFVPDMRYGRLCSAIVKLVTECRIVITLQQGAANNIVRVKRTRSFSVSAAIQIIAGISLGWAIFVATIQKNVRCPECKSWFTLSSTELAEQSNCKYEDKGGAGLKCSKCGYVLEKRVAIKKERESESSFDTNYNNRSTGSGYNSSSRDYGSSDYGSSSSSSDDGGSSTSSGSDGGGGADW